ncbi:hypothetical protein [Aliiglaciecola aliphaticivorans]
MAEPQSMGFADKYYSLRSPQSIAGFQTASLRSDLLFFNSQEK